MKEAGMLVGLVGCGIFGKLNVWAPFLADWH